MGTTVQKDTELTSRNTLRRLGPEIQVLFQHLLNLAPSDSLLQDNHQPLRRDKPAAGMDPVLDEVLRGFMPASSDEEVAARDVVLDVSIGQVRYVLVRIEGKLPERINLSAREQEIVRLVASGLSNKLIADILEISPWTVSTHLRRIFAKLGVRSRAEMVACVLQAGVGIIEA